MRFARLEFFVVIASAYCVKEWRSSWSRWDGEYDTDSRVEFYVGVFKMHL